MFVPSPGLVGSAALRRALLADPDVRAVKAEWSRLTVLLVGIGTLEPSPLLRRGCNTLSAEEQEELRQAGVVGDVCLRYFYSQGDSVASSFDQRVIGIDRGDISRIPRRVGVAGGVDKAEAIGGAARGGWINILITDLKVAEALLAS